VIKGAAAIATVFLHPPPFFCNRNGKVFAAVRTGFSDGGFSDLCGHRICLIFRSDAKQLMNIAKRSAIILAGAQRRSHRKDQVIRNKGELSGFRVALCRLG